MCIRRWVKGEKPPAEGGASPEGGVTVTKDGGKGDKGADGKKEPLKAKTKITRVVKGKQVYYIDEKGRTIRAEGIIDGSHKGRKKKPPPDPAGGKMDGEDRGHLIPEGGVDDVADVNVPENIISETTHSNRGRKRAFDIRTSALKDANPESKVTTVHTPHYHGDNHRPHAVTHELYKDGKLIHSETVLNIEKPASHELIVKKINRKK